jgi:lipid-A-disaccharide synthase-like uncharacterized protein
LLLGFSAVVKNSSFTFGWCVSVFGGGINMTRMCDGAAGIKPCPHPNNCTVNCEFNDAELPEVHWSGIQRQLAWATWAFVGTVLFGLMLGLAYVIGRLI